MIIREVSLGRRGDAGLSRQSSVTRVNTVYSKSCLCFKQAMLHISNLHTEHHWPLLSVNYTFDIYATQIIIFKYFMCVCVCACIMYNV